MKSSLSAVFLSFAMLLQGTEYFVSTAGNDSFEGTSEKKSFRTVRKGLSALDSGDTLTILPGSYHEAVQKVLEGDPANRTLIRAKYPGTVLLHGDLLLTEFQIFDRERGIYSAACPSEPEDVMEHDTLVLYGKARPDFLSSVVPDCASWYFDPAQKKLYLRTSDGQPPEKHRIARAMLGADGLLIKPGLKEHTVNVEIDGLMTRGFLKHDLGAYSSVWGISIANPLNCTIRRCSAVLCCGGINFSNAQKSLIEECTALGNGTSKMVSGGNIIVTTGEDSVIDRCFSFGSRMYGIRFYGQNRNNVIKRSVSIEDKRGSIWIKPSDKDSKLYEVFTPDYVACNHTSYSVFRGNEYDASGKNGKSSLYLKNEAVHSFQDDFADPDHFDLRLTGNSRSRQGFEGKNFFYLAPGGNDANDGRSRKSPKKSLNGIADGSTVYLLPGKYSGDFEVKQNDLVIAGHGKEAPAVITGKVHIAGRNVQLRNLSFISPETAIVSNGVDLRIENCGFSGNKLSLQSEKMSVFRHCAFDESVQKITDHPGHVILMSIVNNLPEGAVLFGNAYAGKVPAQDSCGITLSASFTASKEGDFSLKNESAFSGTSPDGMLIGPCFYLYEPEQIRFFNMKVLPAGTKNASLQFERTSGGRGTDVRYREENGAWKAVPDFSVDTKRSYVALNDLKRDTKYECYVSSRRGNHYRPGNHHLMKGINRKNPGESRSEILRFTTPSSDRAPQTWHVSPKGNDRNPGTTEKPFCTITKASLMTVPGDTVLVHEGTYHESVLLPFSGTAEHPVTYRAAENETVWLEGVDQQYCRTFAVFGKEYVNFDGFRVKRYGTALSNSSGVFLLFGCGNIRMTRTMHDGRGYGYAPALLHARNCHDLVMKNCINISSMGGICIIQSDRIVLEHNVLKLGLIWPLQVSCGKKDAVRFAYNILTDNDRNKTSQALLNLDRIDAVTEYGNLYFTRLPRNLRKVIGGGGKNYTLDEFYKLTGKNGFSVFGDPKFAAMPKQLSWKSWEERASGLKKGIAFQREVNNYENARNPENYHQFRIWDFCDFFANPERKAPDGKIVGLEPEEFKNISRLSKSGELWHNF